MSRIGLDQAGQFSSSGSFEWFVLPDDGDTALVTFLYEDPSGEDVDFYLVHEAEIDGRRRYIGCNAIQGDREDPSLCPLCQEKFRRIDKLFLQLYNHDSDRVEVWDRGRNFVPKITRLVNKFEYLVEQDFEIERLGRKGDTQTTYEIERVEEVLDREVSEFPEKIDIEGSIVLKLTEDEMWDLIDGNFHLESEAPRKRQPRQRSARVGGRVESSRETSGSVRRGPRARGPRTGREAF